MKKHLLVGALLALGAPILASAACPAGVTPDQYFVKQKVAFFLKGSNGPTIYSQAIGTFTGLANGYLSVFITQNSFGNISRDVAADGRWMVNADCSGGMIWIFWDRHFYVINLAISATGAITVAPQVPVDGTTAVPITGNPGNIPPPQTIFPPAIPTQGITAWDELTTQWIASVPVKQSITNPVSAVFTLNPPMVCPPNAANPLDLLSGMTYAFSGTADIGTDGTPAGHKMPAYGGGFMPIPLSTFTALNQGGYSGTLLINNRMIAVFGNGINGTTLNPIYAPNYTEFGRYTMNSDCSGGELLFMSGQFPRQYEFIFTDSTFTKIWYVSDVIGSAPYAGTATKQ